MQGLTPLGHPRDAADGVPRAEKAEIGTSIEDFAFWPAVAANRRLGSRQPDGGRP